MSKRKLRPLLIMAGIAAALAVLLAVLTLTQSEETADTGIPLFDFDADAADSLSYSGEGQDVALLKNSSGEWMPDSDPTLPLEQSDVQTLVEKYAALSALRALTDGDLSELPERSDAPQMVFTLAAGEESRTYTVDQENQAAGVYYVYDESGAAYTMDPDDLSGLCKTLRSLYAAQTLTELTEDDVTAMTVNDLSFEKSDDGWTLADDASYSLDQDAVEKMAATVLEAETDWSITSPEDDSAYGLDDPDVTAALTFADGTSLTVRYGALTEDDDSLCYLASSGAEGIVYEANADYKNAFAVTKEMLYATPETASTAETADIIAENPVGGINDYADAD